MTPEHDERIIQGMRHFCCLAAVLYPMWAFVDYMWASNSEVMVPCLFVRLTALVILFLYIMFCPSGDVPWLSRRWRIRIGAGLQLLTGVGIIGLAVVLGEMQSSYPCGLALVFVGIAALTPCGPKYALVQIGSLTLIYIITGCSICGATVPIVTNALFFVGATIVCVYAANIVYNVNTTVEMPPIVKVHAPGKNRLGIHWSDRKQIALYCLKWAGGIVAMIIAAVICRMCGISPV